MTIFESQTELQSQLDKHEQFILDCADEIIGFWHFVETYNNFFHYFALDGHESDEKEKRLLLKYEKRLEVHETLTNNVLNNVCTDEDAKRAIYIENGRFGSEVGLVKLKEIANKYLRTT